MDRHILPYAWKRIFSFLRNFQGIRAKDEAPTRLFLEGIYDVLRSGYQWRLLPHSYGNWRAVHQRFFARLQKGVWNGLFENRAKDRDEEYIMIDATIVRAHACAAGYVKGGNEECAPGRRSGGTTKIHAKVDSLGNPVKFILTKGRQHEMTQAEGLLQGSHPKAVLADKAYDSQEFQNAIEKIKAIPVIPSRKNSLCPRNIDRYLYKERHLIECFFAKIKHFRRIFSRFDKSPAAFLAFVLFASTLIWCR